MTHRFDGNIAQLLWQTARRRRTCPAVVDHGTTTSYARLLARAAAVATALVAAGIEPGDRIAVWLGGGVDTIAAFFGVAAAGGIAVVLTDTLRLRQVAHILKDCGVALLLTSADVAGAQLPEVTSRRLLLEDIPSMATFEPVSRLGADPAQVVYTSGSTGAPKGVTVTHANLWAAMQAVTSYLGIGPDDRIAALLPFSFVYGMSQVLCAVGSGATLVVERSPIANDLVGKLRTRQATVIAAVPPLWLQLLDAPAFRSEPLPSLRIMTNAGGHLPTTAVRGLRVAQPQAHLFLMYGLTEALRCTYLPPAEVDRHPDSIGRAIPGGEVLVLRDDLTPCDADEVGELVYRGPTVALGYWGDSQATANVFRQHPLRPAGVPDAERVVFTGDLVRRDHEGFLYYVGRRDGIIKTLGYRVSPDEVGDVIYASGEVADCVVVAEPDVARGQRIVAYVVLAGGGSGERLKQHCRTELPRYMQPTRFEARPVLPRLPSGKHDLGAIRAIPAAPRTT